LNQEVRQYTAYEQTGQILADQLREAVIDHEAFEQLIRPCELSRCRATCCHDGVYLSGEEAGRIRKLVNEHGEELAGYGLSLPDDPMVSLEGKLKTATRAAEEGELAEDYPAHFPKTRCVFLDREGRCGIQRLSMEEGRDAWFDKPLTCWIHPIVILPANHKRPRPVVTLVSSENDPQRGEGYPGFASCTHCGRPDEGSKKARQAREVLAAELEMLSKISGRDILGELNAERA
jgi:Fe-S-cluster containining protein